MENEALKQKIGLLQEQIDLLRCVTLDRGVGFDILKQVEDTSTSMLEFSAQVNKIFSVKKISTELLVHKLSRFLLEEAEKNNISVTTTQFTDGEMAIDVAEAIMPALLSAIRCSLVRIASESIAARLNRSVFSAASINLQLRADKEFAYFCIVDDAPSFRTKNGFEKELSRLQKIIREAISSLNGWCTIRSLSEHGALIECKIPIIELRQYGQVFEFGSQRVAISSASIVECLTLKGINKIHNQNNFLYFDYKDDLVPLCTIATQVGLQQLTQGALDSDFETYVSLVHIADFRVAIVTSKMPSSAQLRTVECEEYMAHTTWHKKVCTFINDGVPQLAPYLSGKEIYDFCKSIVRGYENN